MKQVMKRCRVNLGTVKMRVIWTESLLRLLNFCLMNCHSMMCHSENVTLRFILQICSRKITATDFRRAKTTLGRRAGIDSKQLSRAMLHSAPVADKYYDIDIFNNQSSLGEQMCI